MSKSDENIRKRINEAAEKKSQSVKASQEAERRHLLAVIRQSEDAKIRAREAAVKRAEVLDLCARFAVWGTQHRIPYNSHSWFARGWLLGSRSGPPSHYHSGAPFNGYDGESIGSSSWTENSTRSLLVYRSGDVQELITNDITTKSSFFSTKFNQPVRAYPEMYEIEGVMGIEWTIADIAIKNGVEWP